MITTHVHRFVGALALAFVLAPGALAAQQDGSTDTTKAAAQPAPSNVEAIVIQHMRAPDKRGVNQFEPPKDDGVAFTGFKLDWGGAFAQQFQDLNHENSATAKVVNGVNANQLMDIGAGFNNATANLDLNAQIAPGIRVALTTYLSSRHHQDTWVKDGYLLIDESPLHVKVLEDVMKIVTVKAGHFEIDYGDAHYRRSDNGRALYNPFVGNLILDAFTTQIGAQVYARKNGLIAMGGVTGGEIHGEVRYPGQRGMALLGKLGFDRTFGDARVRLTGSAYHQAKGISNTLYGGDRGGSRYYLVMENTAATTDANAWSGTVNPGFGNKVDAVMVNPFVQVKGLELFGTLEQAKGRSAAETVSRTWQQGDVDAVYRFKNDDLFVGGRYDIAKGELNGLPGKPSVERWSATAGWFITNNLVMKGEWVRQAYDGFPLTDIRSGGKFHGFMVEGVVAF
jgi:hypothetical protein